ncbi:MAG: helical backbone metal receptor [Burkholderiaceae bacterium]
MTARIVSLVPSLTELLIELGLGEQIVGRTGFCIHPRQAVQAIPKVGGTKTIDIEKILSLKPTHLVVNREENPLAPVIELSERVPNVVKTHVVTIEDNRQLYRQFGDEFGTQTAATRMLDAFDVAHERLLARQFSALRVLYLIWRDPWMTVTSDTFISHMLAQAGMISQPDTRGTAPPESDAQRYPVLAAAEMAKLTPEWILLSTEPYRFRQSHIAPIQAIDGLNATPGRLIDGEMTSWYGPRAIKGLDYLSNFRDQLALATTEPGNE